MAGTVQLRVVMVAVIHIQPGKIRKIVILWNKLTPANLFRLAVNIVKYSNNNLLGAYTVRTKVNSNCFKIVILLNSIVHYFYCFALQQNETITFFILMANM